MTNIPIVYSTSQTKLLFANGSYLICCVQIGLLCVSLIPLPRKYINANCDVLA